MKRLALALMLALSAPMAYADELIGAYVAYIGQQDLYNSRGARLTEPWQVLRQDRANYHRFGISQPGDEWDPFFGNIDNRAAMERWIMSGYIENNARNILLQGGATVFVRIYGSNGWGQRIEVTVTR